DQPVSCTPSALNRYYKLVKDNNGIKAANLVGLFGPLGVPNSAYGTILVPELESFGKRRGDHAHASSTVVLSNVLDPQTEHQRSLRVVKELGTLDQWLVEHKRKVR
ncbi:MAG: hypothetical protein KC619_20970, partial [Myxococcales bacterium]|nr:hypothetical protein [Myxococcales bacterium]